MDKHSHELFSPHILAEALNRFDCLPEPAVPLDGFENFIYEIQTANGPRILRIAHSLHQTADKIEGELDWVNYLADHQVGVARALPSKQGKWVEVIPAAEGTHFSAVTFEKAPGAPPSRADWTSGLPVTLGKLLGRINHLAQTYIVPQQRIKRAEMLNELEGFAAKYLPASEKIAIQKYDEVLTYLRTLPTTADVYGLVHQDAHGGNFFVADGRITLFDFDDCLYSWYAHDIAMALFYVLPLHCTAQDTDFGKQFLADFLSGYAQENTINYEALTQIPYFLKLREIDLYAAIHRSLDLNDLDPWCANFMRDRKYNIENDIPYFLSPQDFPSILPTSLCQPHS